MPPGSTTPSRELRRQAEVLLQKLPARDSKLPAGDMPKLMLELQVHQVELEMQNEELLRASASSSSTTLRP